MIKVFAPAKINLSLLVGKPFNEGKYKNYHPLNSLVVFSNNIGDNVSLKTDEDFHFNITGQFGSDLIGFENNLVVRAAKLMSDEFERKLDFSIELEKNLPIAAGIGGGSSDAAATILAINKVWDLHLSTERMCEIGEFLGADVPVCIRRESVIMKSIGEVFQKSPKIPRQIPVLLANPLIECPTQAVFQCFDKIGNFDLLDEIEYQDCAHLNDLVAMLEKLPNSLLRSATQIVGEIAILIDAIKGLKGVKFVSMSGSGASVFGIFDTIENAQLGETVLCSQFKQGDIWARSGIIA